MDLNSYLCVVHDRCLGACAYVCVCVCLQGCAGTCITESFSLRSVPSSLSSVAKKKEEEVFHCIFKSIQMSIYTYICI